MQSTDREESVIYRLKPARWTLPILLGAISIFAIAACGGGDDDADTDADPAVAAQDTAVPAADTAVPAADATAEPVKAPDTVSPPPTSLPTPPKFQESPLLAALVASGDLPPVEDRLPANPLVIQVVEEIGKYGGDMNRIYNGARDHCNYSRVSREGIMRWSSDGFTLMPAVADKWTPNDDGSEWTIHIREGIRWSDGDLLDADDFLYQFESVILNEELGAPKPKWVTVGGELGTVTKIDQFTVKYSFANPYWTWPAAATEEGCATGGIGGYMFVPSHYMKQFHKDFAGEAAIEALMVEFSFEEWSQLYTNRGGEKFNPEKPTTRAWQMINEIGSPLWIAERNPYFYAVDPEGNQLPYLDRLVYQLVEDSAVIQVKAAAGEVDFQNRRLQFASYPVFKEREEEGNYRVMNWVNAGAGVNTGLFMNQSFQGVEGDILRTTEFRQALSVAIDRDSISEITYLGLGEGRQPVPTRGHPHYPGDDAAYAWTQFDPALANTMLDAILPDKDGDGFRKLPNGDTLFLIITTQTGASADQAEQVALNWAAVGIKVKVDAVVRATLTARNDGNEFHIITWSVDTTCCLFSEPNKTLPVTSATHLPMWGPAFGRWRVSDGEEGIKPPDDVIALQDLFLLGQISPIEEANAIAREIYTIVADENYIIGLVGAVPRPFIVKNDLRNVPELSVGDWPLRGPSTAYPEQFFWRVLP